MPHTHAGTRHIHTFLPERNLALAVGALRVVSLLEVLVGAGGVGWGRKRGRVEAAGGPVHRNRISPTFKAGPLKELDMRVLSVRESDNETHTTLM